MLVARTRAGNIYIVTEMTIKYNNVKWIETKSKRKLIRDLMRRTRGRVECIVWMDTLGSFVSQI